MTNGGGGYLCVDTSVPLGDDAQALIWWKDRAPKTGQFWPVLDAWMEIGLSS